MRALGGHEGFSDYKRSKLKVERCMEESPALAQASTSCLMFFHLKLTHEHVLKVDKRLTNRVFLVIFLIFSIFSKSYIHVLQTYSMISNPGLSDSTICGSLLLPRVKIGQRTRRGLCTLFTNGGMHPNPRTLETYPTDQYR